MSTAACPVRAPDEDFEGRTTRGQHWSQQEVYPTGFSGRTGHGRGTAHPGGTHDPAVSTGSPPGRTAAAPVGEPGIMPYTARTPRLAVRTLLSVVVLTATLLASTWGTATVQAAPSGLPGPWQPPAEGSVLERFDPPASPWSAGHRGIDLAAPPGTTVVAPTAGVVTFAGQVGGKPVLVVSHGDLRSTFEPVEATAAVGARVSAGQLVGQVAADAGSSHCAPTGCLHWGVRRGAAYLDPLALLGQASPIVLLPLPAA